MNKTLPRTPALAGLLLVLTACGQAPDTATETPAAPAAAAAPTCNRQCLIAATDAYVAALVAHDPAAAPLASNVVFVENIQKKMPGEGLWQTAVKAPTTFAIHVPDEINGTAGYLAMMTRMAPPPAPQGASPADVAAAASQPPVEQPVMVALRLKVDGNGKITEAEHLLAGIREAQMANLQAPRPGILAEIPAEQRLPHERLLEIGYSYYPALDENDSDLTFFAPDCERHENGMITASGAPAPQAPAVPGTAATPRVARDCYGQIESGSFQYIARIENRRVFAADPVTGLVMGLSHFRHPMDNLPYTVTNIDGSTSERTAENFRFAPFDLPAAHIFKIGADGRMHEIEAMGFTTAYNSPTGWE
ncbi:MAG TPA: hypothetical protein VIC71_05120 [Gammaproteobacteria bacterium]